MKPDKVVWWLVFELSLTGLVLQVPAHAQQQQDVHGEQVEGEQQRRALTGAEGHSQHPHQAGAAAPRLQGGEREKVGEVRGKPGARTASQSQLLRWRTRRPAQLANRDSRE